MDSHYSPGLLRLSQTARDSQSESEESARATKLNIVLYNNKNVQVEGGVSLRQELLSSASMLLRERNPKIVV